MNENREIAEVNNQTPVETNKEVEGMIKAQLVKLFPTLFEKKADPELESPRGDMIERPDKRNEITTRRATGMVRSSRNLSLVKTKSIMIAGERYNIDPETLMRMIKRITQDVGEYKSFDGPYAAILIKALRHARGDMVSLLEEHFNIHWRITDNVSEFYYA